MKSNKLLQITLALGGATFFLLMLTYSYQGGFTRYMADDYCNAVMFSNNAVGGLVQRYLSGFGGNRYSNIWLVGVSEFFGARSIPVLPVFHIALWGVGLTWTMAEVKKTLQADWSFAMTFFLGLSVAFFALIEAPNLYQIVYWRSSMSTHFAPVVYGTLLVAYIFRQANKAETQAPSASAKTIIFFSAFIIGGFSEPADAVQITALVLSACAVWLWGQSATKNKILVLLAYALGAALLSLVVMVVSPANERRLGDNPPGLMLLAHDALYFSYIFVVKTLSDLPLPSFISVLMPALLAWAYSRIRQIELSSAQKRNINFVALALPFVAYLLIVASFSPSVYGQGYPVARVRFYACLIMALCLLVEGALIGTRLAQIQFFAHPVWTWLAIVAFFVVGVVYPFRAVVKAYNEIPDYRVRAANWDERDAIIRDLKAQGETHLTVAQFDGVHGTKELDTFATHWVNKCAAQYYGVKSIRAIPYE